MLCPAHPLLNNNRINKNKRVAIIAQQAPPTLAVTFPFVFVFFLALALFLVF
ncbi:hypothetical protein ASPVEDRAFT_39819 [Aspergillus versicolor CBS 583.65]|uniref:Uncharacterized protein n=1 Tax=Aspergillus versicolor CBS 583.65 TaxID=1036611 RepID=A0A1L9PFV4_ASPVE|nr:uncharacterized protein ASPVEDRAFT_39819 [Aspergillus versicolor CBS 583.65]OJJ00369.1 hypothetical protein ASPVEDRAFT_39819 [Aspergillus versicolor CBS 583.65]